LTLRRCNRIVHFIKVERCDVEQLFELTHNPKVLELEKAENGHVRLVLTLSKLGQVTKLDFFLTETEAGALAAALTR
jgi:hypothetical protein